MMFYDVLWFFMMMMFYDVLWCSMVFYGVLWCSKMLYDVLWCSVTFYDFYDVLWCSKMFYVLRAFLVSFCQSVPPEFLRSFFNFHSVQCRGLYFMLFQEKPPEKKQWCISREQHDLLRDALPDQIVCFFEHCSNGLWPPPPRFWTFMLRIFLKGYWKSA